MHLYNIHNSFSQPLWWGRKGIPPSLNLNSLTSRDALKELRSKCEGFISKICCKRRWMVERRISWSEAAAIVEPSMVSLPLGSAKNWFTIVHLFLSNFFTNKSAESCKSLWGRFRRTRRKERHRKYCKQMITQKQRPVKQVLSTWTVEGGVIENHPHRYATPGNLDSTL